MRREWLGAWGLGSAVVAAALIAACKGDIGPAGKDGAPGQMGSEGPPGPQHGLDISPVPVNLSGLTGDQIVQVGEGSYLVNAIAACGDCHNNPMTGAFLAGGFQFSLGGSNFVTARNLTPDSTTGLKLTQAQFVTAMRTGEDFTNSPDGGTPQQLIVMPWPTFRWMSTADLEAIYAYLKAVPPVMNMVPADMKGPAAAAQPVPFPSQYNEGMVPRNLPAETDFMDNPIPDPGWVLRGLAISPVPYAIDGLSASDQALFGRGSYLVTAVGDCNGCHTNPDRDMTPVHDRGGLRRLSDVQRRGDLCGAGRRLDVPHPRALSPSPWHSRCKDSVFCTGKAGA